MERHFNIQIGKPCELYDPDPIANEGEWVEVNGFMEWVYNYDAIVDIAKHIDSFSGKENGFHDFFHKTDWIGKPPEQAKELPIQDKSPIVLACGNCAGPFDTDFVNGLYKCKFCGTLWSRK